jgi:membrane complex biogenesis BtpA family protein
VKKSEFLKKIKGNEPYLIGMVHFAPLAHCPDTPGFETILENARKDLEIINKAGFDAVIFENNYDSIHLEFLPEKSQEEFSILAATLKQDTNLEIGISALWNDYKTALLIAKENSFPFVRIPVFVDEVKTFHGFEVHGNPKEIFAFKDSIDGREIALFTDIQVKHSQLLNKRPIAESAQEAQTSGSDGLIVTGEWTAVPPTREDLEAVSNAVNLPIFVGSGATVDNIYSLKKYASGFIVGTSLKEGENLDKDQETNIKPWVAKMDLQRASTFVKTAKQ